MKKIKQKVKLLALLDNSPAYFDGDQFVRSSRRIKVSQLIDTESQYYKALRATYKFRSGQDFEFDSEDYSFCKIVFDIIVAKLN